MMACGKQRPIRHAGLLVLAICLIMGSGNCAPAREVAGMASTAVDRGSATVEAGVLQVDGIGGSNGASASTVRPQPEAIGAEGMAKPQKQQQDTKDSSLRDRADEPALLSTGKLDNADVGLVQVKTEWGKTRKAQPASTGEGSSTADVEHEQQLYVTPTYASSGSLEELFEKDICMSGDCYHEPADIADDFFHRTEDLSMQGQDETKAEEGHSRSSETLLQKNPEGWHAKVVPLDELTGTFVVAYGLLFVVSLTILLIIQFSRPNGEERVELGPKEFWKHSVIWWGILLYSAFLQYTAKPIGSKEIVYDRNKYWGIVGFILFIGLLTVRKCEEKMQSVAVNRQQTDEWRGWAQVLFVLYHYLDAAETYNLQRIMVACYLWMSGYGNYFFYTAKGDFSSQRFCSTMFRINLLTLFLCPVLGKGYVTWYFCGMMTFWTIYIYLVMRIFKSWNEQPYKALFKIVAAWALIEVFFLIDQAVPENFLRYTARWLFTSDKDVVTMAKRIRMDCVIAPFGMVCGWVVMQKPVLYDVIVGGDRVSKTVHVIFVLLCLGSMVPWYIYAYEGQDKDEYMTHHMVTSLVPVTAYLVVRNIAPLRKYYSWGMAKLGAISLELYILQFAVLLKDFHLQVYYLGGHRERTHGFGRHNKTDAKFWINFTISMIIFVILTKASNDATGYFTRYFISKDESVLNRRTLIGSGSVLIALVAGALIYSS